MFQGKDQRLVSPLPLGLALARFGNLCATLGVDLESKPFGYKCQRQPQRQDKDFGFDD